MNIHGLIRAIERRKGADERLANGRVELARRELERAANALYAANAKALAMAQVETPADAHVQALERLLIVEDELREILTLKPSHRRSAIVALINQVRAWNSIGE